MAPLRLPLEDQNLQLDHSLVTRGMGKSQNLELGIVEAEFGIVGVVGAKCRLWEMKTQERAGVVCRRQGGQGSQGDSSGAQAQEAEHGEQARRRSC